MTSSPAGRPEAPANVPTVALADARAELSKIVTLAEHTGRITAITRYGKPVAAVVPAALLHLLSGAHIGPRPMQADDLQRLAAHAEAATTRPSSDDIRTALDDIRAHTDETLAATATTHFDATPASPVSAVEEQLRRALQDAAGTAPDLPDADAHSRADVLVGLLNQPASTAVDTYRHLLAAAAGNEEREPTLGEVLASWTAALQRAAG